jgi:peptide methionine sulfoxide reductase msrA/msrB
MTRIQDQSKSSPHLTLWLGLLAAVAVVTGSYFFIRAQTEPKMTGELAYMKPMPSDAKLRSSLNKEQYHVMRENGTEPPFHNLYWENQRAGIYVDFVTGEPLFGSLDKFDGGTGLPSFTKPISKDHIVLKRDTSFGLERIEIRASKSDSHLGHLFNDGPTGQRYTVNSAALHFIPLEKMQAEGYGEFRALFEEKK